MHRRPQRTPRFRQFRPKILHQPSITLAMRQPVDEFDRHGGKFEMRSAECGITNNTILPADPPVV